MSNKSPQELEEYVKDMFRMVWRDAEHGQADKLVVCESATNMVMKRVTSHMQAGFEYAIPNVRAYNKLDRCPRCGDSQYACSCHDAEEALIIEQRQRAAEWLLWSKENQ